LAGSLLIDFFKDNFLFGDHEIKLGLDYRQTVSNYNDRMGNGLRLRTEFGDISDFGTAYRADLFRDLDIKYGYQRFSVFLQDTINIGNLTLLLGLRYDSQTGDVKENTIAGTNVAEMNDVDGVNYNFQGVDQPATDLPFDFNFFSPRMGLTWDLTGDGKTIVKANFSIYGSTLDPYEFLESVFLIDSSHRFYWDDFDNDLVVDPGELEYNRTTDNYDDIISTPPSFWFDENLKIPKTMEMVLGLERELSSDIAVGLNLIYRRSYDITWAVPYVWDSGDWRLVDITDWESFTVIEDGETYTVWDTSDVYDEGLAQVRNRPNYNIVYTGAELTFKKRLAAKWMVDASFTLQDTKVNYGEGSYYNPTDHEPVDYLDGNPGPQDTDSRIINSRWMFKAGWLYQLPWGINFAGKLQVREGHIFPVVRRLDFERWWDYEYATVMTEPFGDSRYDLFWMLDLRIEKGFSLGKMGNLYVSIDAFNIFNSDLVLDQGNDISSSSYLVAKEILNPRIFRLGLRYEF